MVLGNGCGMREMTRCSKVALKSVIYGKYMVAEWYGSANANRHRRGSWEKFRVRGMGHGRVALKSHHGRYLVAEQNGDVNANRWWARSWETFSIMYCIHDRYIAIKSHHGKYLAAKSNGGLTAKCSSIGEEEKWIMECV